MKLVQQVKDKDTKSACMIYRKVSHPISHSPRTKKRRFFAFRERRFYGRNRVFSSETRCARRAMWLAHIVFTI